MKNSAISQCMSTGIEFKVPVFKLSRNICVLDEDYLRFYESFSQPHSLSPLMSIPPASTISLSDLVQSLAR